MVVGYKNRLILYPDIGQLQLRVQNVIYFNLIYTVKRRRLTVAMILSQSVERILTFMIGWK